MKKTLTVVIALVLVVVMSVAGTVAYLTATTDPITNTFTVGNINIALTETKSDFKMVPGSDIDKDPKVTVLAESEACWLFVKVEKSANLDSFVTYNIAEGWTPLDGVSGVYYREVAASATDDQVFSVLADDKVTVKSDVTKTMMDDLGKENATQPTLTFTAYAVQKDNIADAATAWAKVS